MVHGAMTRAALGLYIAPGQRTGWAGVGEAADFTLVEVVRAMWWRYDDITTGRRERLASVS